MILNTLQEAIIHFDNPQNCIDYMIHLRWPDGVVYCPTCGSTAVTWMPGRRLFQCKNKHPRKQFSVKVGTVFEDSPIALGKWLLVAWMLGSCRNGMSSHEVARTIGITQKSAWFMLHRLREAMVCGTGKIGSGAPVEIDETFVGGKVKNIHKSKIKKGISRFGTGNKTIVLGMVERGGEVRAKVIVDRKKVHIQPVLEANVAHDSWIITDEHSTYPMVAGPYHHDVINHLEGFARGHVHTNTIENFWSCLKRTLKGTYVSVAPKHLNAYVTEQVFRFNVRKGFTEQQRHFVALHGIQGKRLTYTDLISR